MKRILLSLLCATSVFGQTVSVDVQNTTATDLYLYQVDQGNITVDFKDGGVDNLVSGAAIFWYATNGLRSDAVVEIPVTVASATNQVLFPITADKFPLATPGSRPWTYGVEVAGKMHGDGRLYIKTRPAVTNATLDLIGKTYMDWTGVTNHIGTADYGPYQFTAGFAWTTNANGRLVLTSTAGTPAWGDVLSKPFTNISDIAHSDLDALAWIGSGHTGTAGKLAFFGEGGLAGETGLGAGLYLDGNEDVAVSTSVVAGASAGATAVQPATLSGYATTGTVAALDVRVTGVETGKVDKTDADYTNTAALAAGAVQTTETRQVTIDAANQHTNTFGGLLTVLGRSVVAGENNTVGDYGFVAGSGNTVGLYGFAAGVGNTVGNHSYAVGYTNTVGEHGFAAGYGNIAGYEGYAFGQLNTVGAIAFGAGKENLVGDYGFGAGTSGRGAFGSFVFSDYPGNLTFDRTAYANAFSVRASGGTYFETPGFEVTGNLSAGSMTTAQAASNGTEVVNYSTATGLIATAVSGYVPTSETNIFVRTNDTRNVSLGGNLTVSGSITAGSYSATITPYPIAYATNVTISATNGMEQRIEEITGPMNITFPAGVTNLLTRIFLTIPPYSGTGVVSMAAGPAYTFITPLVSTNWVGTNAYTHVWYVSEQGTTNSTATVARGSVQ